MKKKIKDLTREERIVLCYKQKSCEKCSFYRGGFICVLKQEELTKMLASLSKTGEIEVEV